MSYRHQDERERAETGRTDGTADGSKERAGSEVVDMARV
jgi:hypothetical protein